MVSMALLSVFFALLATLMASTTTAFCPPNPMVSTARALKTTTPTSRFMFSPGDKPQPLQEENDDSSLSKEENSIVEGIDTPSEPRKMYAKDFMRGGEMKELQFTDPAMAANTNPFAMSWWAWILFGFPFVLLADDVLHFIPTEGPFSVLKI